MSVREYRELEAGAHSPNFETWDRICKLFGWPQTFTRARMVEGTLDGKFYSTRTPTSAPAWRCSGPRR